jgi:hypothetical protein
MRVTLRMERCVVRVTCYGASTSIRAEVPMWIESDEHTRRIVISGGELRIWRGLRTALALPLVAFIPDGAAQMKDPSEGIEIAPLGAIRGTLLCGKPFRRTPTIPECNRAELRLEFRGFRSWRQRFKLDWSRVAKFADDEGLAIGPDGGTA